MKLTDEKRAVRCFAAAYPLAIIRDTHALEGTRERRGIAMDHESASEIMRWTRGRFEDVTYG